jgi:adenylylsulfate kinase-like enzyme
MSTQSNQNIVWHASQVNSKDRAILLGQKPLTLWLTGLSTLGKSTLAYALEQTLIWDSLQILLVYRHCTSRPRKLI